MASTTPSTLRRISDSGPPLATPAEDVRGRRVVDAAGEAVGVVDDLYVDDRENRVRFLLAASGGFLGLAEVEFLIPVGAVTRVAGAAVHLGRTRDEVADAPAYAPRLVDERYLAGLAAYYGHRPYWEPGYAYPPFPDYPAAGVSAAAGRCGLIPESRPAPASDVPAEGRGIVRPEPPTEEQPMDNHRRRRLAVLVAGLVLAAAPAAAEPEVVRGQVTKVASAADRLTIRTTAGKEITFAAVPGSRLEADGKPLALADLKEGRRVRVTYREAAGRKEVVALKPAVVTDEALKKEVGQALAAAKQYTFQQKDEYAERVRGVIADLDDRIDRLEAEAKDAGAEAEAKLRARLADLKKHRTALKDRLDKVGSAAADAWDDVKDGFSAAARELERVLDF
ncbi:MAG: PRC-barrel domain-containing protein [Gemmataceae bacterium]|nr:PRC-barrel domain-containing protein [Gemmataceae bacterium]